LAERAVEQRIGLREVAEEERKVEDPNSFTTPASEVVDATNISCTPPCMRRLLLQLVAERGCWRIPAPSACRRSWPPRFGEALDAQADRMVGVVQVAELEDAFLHVLGVGVQRQAGAQQQEESTVHAVVSRCCAAILESAFIVVSDLETLSAFRKLRPLP
jgi:hypothetical protein